MSKVYWVTGMSGVGKTTFANILKKKLNERKIVSILIDGDELREILGSDKENMICFDLNCKSSVNDNYR